MRVPIALTAALLVGCAGLGEPGTPRSIPPISREDTTLVQYASGLHIKGRVENTKSTIGALVDYFNARTDDWRSPGGFTPPVAMATLTIVINDGTHRVLGLSCGGFSTARSSMAHALGDGSSFLVRSGTHAELHELLNLIGDRALTAQFASCKA
jgi:hypothetical protein